MLCAQPCGVAVSGPYAYVTATQSLVVVDISNPASPAVRGSVVSSSLLVGVREAGSCARGWRRRAALASAPPMMLAAAAPPPADALSRSHVLCAQARSVAVSGLYAYVAAEWSDSLVVVDISNLASPVIRGSVVSSSLLDRVRVRPGACARGGIVRCGMSRPSCSRPRRHHLLKPFRALTCCAHRLISSQ